MLNLSRLLPRRRDKQCTLLAEDDEPWQNEAHCELSYVHRSLIVLRPREPYARWVRTVEPGEYPLAQALQDDAIAFLIPTQFGTAANSEEFLAEHWAHFFAQALEQFEQDRERRPPQRSLAMRRQWFDIDLCRKRVLNTLLTRPYPKSDVDNWRSSAKPTRHEVPSPGSKVARRWLMRTMVPTAVVRYLSSKATFSPQRKSLRVGLAVARVARPAWVFLASAAPPRRWAPPRICACRPRVC